MAYHNEHVMCKRKRSGCDAGDMNAVVDETITRMAVKAGLEMCDGENKVI